MWQKHGGFGMNKTSLLGYGRELWSRLSFGNSTILSVLLLVVLLWSRVAKKYSFPQSGQAGVNFMQERRDALAISPTTWTPSSLQGFTSLSYSTVCSGLHLLPES